MVKFMMKHISIEVCVAVVLLVCTKAVYTPAQEHMRQQHALQGLASAGHTPYLA